MRFLRSAIRSFICDSSGLSLTPEHGSHPCLSPPQRVFGMHQAVKSVTQIALDHVSKPSRSREASGDGFEEAELITDTIKCLGLGGALCIVYIIMPPSQAVPM